jgi:flagellar biosynthesis/type III secretory pathway protein FliH
MTPRARIVRASSAVSSGEAMFPLRPSAAAWRRIAREEVEARLAAERIVRDARAHAETIVERARTEARGTADQAASDAREQAEAEFAAQWLTRRSNEDTRLDGDAERIVAVAVVLAERLLGATLALHPDRVVDLARVAIGEARGARRVTIEAHPLDASALEGLLTDAAIDVRSVEVRTNEALARGELRLQTDVGTIDAKLAPRLERLAAALRDLLL